MSEKLSTLEKIIINLAELKIYYNNLTPEQKAALQEVEDPNDHSRITAILGMGVEPDSPGDLHFNGLGDSEEF